MNWFGGTGWVEAGGALAGAYGLKQARSHHGEAFAQASHLHQKAIDQAQGHHVDALRHERQLHEEAIAFERQVFKHEMGIERKYEYYEATRDMMSQRHHQVNTLMIMETLMFASGFVLVVEGTLPEEIILDEESTGGAVGYILAYVYIVLTALAIALQVMSMIYAMKVQSRITKFRVVPRIGVSTRSFNTPPRQQDYRVRGMCLSGDNARNFDLYYRLFCRKMFRTAKALFMMGMFANLFAAAVLVFARCEYTHDLFLLGVIFAAIIGSLVGTVLCIERCERTSTIPRELRMTSTLNEEEETGRFAEELDAVCVIQSR